MPFILLFLLAGASWAAPLRLVNFNMMCNFCGDRDESGTFKQRLVAIADTITRHNPDLISFQEMKDKAQIKRLMKLFKDDYVLVTKAFYGDAALLARKSRFKLLDDGGEWLGPNPNLPLGWTTSLPRRVQWAKLRDADGFEFVLVGSHMDNNGKNKVPSAKAVNALLKSFDVPVLFAGDTNITVDHEAYALLVGDTLENTYPGADQATYYSNAPWGPEDLCHRYDGDCRIDHVLGTKGVWRTNLWGVDLFRYHGSIGFASDHRAVVVDLERL